MQPRALRLTNTAFLSHVLYCRLKRAGLQYLRDESDVQDFHNVGCTNLSPTLANCCLWGLSTSRPWQRTELTGSRRKAVCCKPRHNFKLRCILRMHVQSHAYRHWKMLHSESGLIWNIHTQYADYMTSIKRGTRAAQRCFSIDVTGRGGPSDAS